MFDRIFKIKESDGRVKYMLKSMVLRTYEHNVSQVGGQLSFFLILSTFPFLIFLNTLIASFNIPPKMVESFLMPIFPAEVVGVISSYVEYISNNKSIGLLSIGIVAAVFSASRAGRALSYALNVAHGVKDHRSFFGEILFSMVLIVAIGVMITIMIIIMAFSTDLVEKIAQGMSIPITLINLIDIWRWITFSVLILFSFALMYKLVPGVKLKMRDVLPGTIFSAVGFMSLTVAFSIFVEYFMRNSALYGTIGTIIVLLFWLYIASMIIVLGAEINGTLMSMPERLRRVKRR